MAPWNAIQYNFTKGTTRVKYNLRSVLETETEQTWAIASKHNWVAEKTINQKTQKQLEGEREKEKIVQCLDGINFKTLHMDVQNSILTSYNVYILSGISQFSLISEAMSE